MKKLMLLMFFVTGCATTAGYNQKVKTWVGSSEEKLVETWGAPLQSYQINENKKALVYVANDGSSTAYGNGYASTSVNACKTQFFTENGLIYNYQFQGNTCKAKEDKPFYCNLLWPLDSFLISKCQI